MLHCMCENKVSKNNIYAIYENKDSTNFSHITKPDNSDKMYN